MVGYLKASGLTITGVPASREYVVFRGAPSQFNSTFKTSLHAFKLKGMQVVAPASAPSLPSRIGAEVAGVSLDQSRMLTRPNLLSPDGPRSSNESQLRTEATQRAPLRTPPSSTRRARATSASTL
ncbi:hypothetical protein Lxx02930 [Leifsonia xyli subsp. xyli str. CTCB07]|uniref:Peptidase S53 activation domain-containing protein n=1 Tax=Leifsonia xyli subsp. xyli (strain CTCB07) TaxID=281090 RepID=Q6AH24_LEIXX|nr:protease pro-enzyme activation domain-containing protein [Leifsonia xyli]AAT88321.1 hypothetical protein Lxx02930 [Leifsonia xyli subsp. xyli str. CTCB07]